MDGKFHLARGSKVDNREGYASVCVPAPLRVINAQLDKVPAIKNEDVEDREAQLAPYTR
jgi:hypothetical protein